MKFVTGNIHKWEEANAIIGGNLEMVALDLEEIQSIDIEEIITYKAKKAYELLGEPALCEDVGLFFDAWNGLPGPEIKWFLKTVGNEGMVKMLSGFENRSARAICCVGWYDGNQVYHVLGICPGNISKEVRGTTNFGRNPIFIPDGYEESFAELPIDIKNQISHRYLAWSQVKKMLYSV